MLEWIKSAALGIGMALGGGPADHQPEHPEKPPTDLRYAASEMRRRSKEQMKAVSKQLDAEHATYSVEQGTDVEKSLRDARTQADQLAD